MNRGLTKHYSEHASASRLVLSATTAFPSLSGVLETELILAHPNII
jgi:hypothetical protein